MSAPKDGTTRAAADRANPDTLADFARLIALGSLLQGQVNQVRRKVDMDAAGTNPNNLATLDALDLPASGKACSIVRATVRAGGVTGELTPVAYGTTPATTQIAVGPNGDIVTLAADAITDMDVVYVPERGDVIETVFPVTSDAIDLAVIAPAIPARGIVLLADVEALEGTATGRKIVLAPGAGAPAAGQARLDVAKDTITFAAADAVTRARVVLVVTAAEQLTDVLESNSQLI